MFVKSRTSSHIPYFQNSLSSIYIHIPFCKQACHYCDFHFSTQIRFTERMVNCIKKEIELRQGSLKEPIKSLYFGGGTPSLLSENQLSNLIKTVHYCFNCTNDWEVTLEANPENLNTTYLQGLLNCGVNRLSIGVQTFQDATLQFLNRSHSAEQARQSIDIAQKNGFSNISVDLIYGIPKRSHAALREDLTTLLDLRIPHISCYMLTLEPKTVFYQWQKTKKLPPIQEGFVMEQYDIVLDTLTKAQFEHYEISNFAMPLFRSRHNSNYWKFNNYLGIGPAAHSLVAQCRYRNINHNHQYMKSIESGRIPFEREVLSKKDSMNEYVMLGLRLLEGLSLPDFYQTFQVEFTTYYADAIQKWQKSKHLIKSNSHIYLTREGKKITDSIVLDFFKL